MSGDVSLIADLDEAMRSRPDRRRQETLRQVTDLFVGNAPNYNDEQVTLFGNVFGRLLDDTDVSARVELSGRLAVIDNAPVNVIGRLADDEAIDVAAPVLTNSNQLNQAQLVNLASTKDRRHMLAIAKRQNLNEHVTDALLTRGDQQIAKTVATNSSARVSERGYESLVGFAAKDASLAEHVAVRPDIPERHFQTLIAIAPEPVRLRLAETNPRLAERIVQAIAANERASKQQSRDYSQAKATVKAAADAGQLDDTAILEFAKAEKFEETVVALAVVVRLPIGAVSRLLSSEPTDTILIVAKAADLTWPTAKQLLLLRTAGHASPQDIESARMNFIRLRPETAKQGLQFYKDRWNRS